MDTTLATEKRKRSEKWLAQQVGLSKSDQRFMHLCEQIKSDGNWPYSDDEEDWDFALHEARKYVKYEERIGQRVRRQRELYLDVETKLTESESRRANALMLFWAKHAAGRTEVRQFREHILDNKLLTMQEAYAFLRSPALQMFSLFELEQANIPIMGHSATIRCREFENKVNHGDIWRLTVHVEPLNRELSCRRVLSKSVEHLWFAGEDGWGNAVDVWPHSIMSDLLKASESLGKQYEWKAGQAAMFILTDIVPLVHPLTYTITRGNLATSVVTIAFHSWVTEQTVRRAYHEAQQKIYSKTPRSIGPKNAAIFEFVVEQMDSEGNKPTWRELMEQWNRQQQRNNWTYVGVQNFWRDFDRAQNCLLKPQLRERPPKRFEDMTPAEQIVEKIRKYTDGENDETESNLDNQEGQ